MPSENPYSSPESTADSNQEEATDVSAGKAAYNVVSDTLAGLNVRASDNKYQAKFIFVSVILCAAIGAVLAYAIPRWQLPWYGGAVCGAFLGLMAGFFLSGFILMIYRGKRHLEGKHD